MTTLTLETLIKARALYASAPSHCRERGMPELGTYCPVTALYHAQGGLHIVGVSTGLSALRDAMGNGYVTAYNAEHTTEEVLAAFDKAIASLN